MQNIITYFNNSPDWHRAAFSAFIFLLIWNIENLIPITTGYNKNRHAWFNASFLLVLAPVQVGMSYLISTITIFETNHHWSIFNQNYFTIHPILLFILSFILLDLGEYIYHIIMHKYQHLWLFHSVHHSDEKVDVTSTLREHPIETIIRLALLIVWITILGVPIWALFLRQFIQLFSNLLSHSNFNFSEKANHYINFVFVTPNSHHIHHHARLPLTNTNYGDVLSIWDRLFNTHIEVSQKQIKYGIDTFGNEIFSDNRLKLFFRPFTYDKNKKL